MEKGLEKPIVIWRGKRKVWSLEAVISLAVGRTFSRGRSYHQPVAQQGGNQCLHTLILVSSYPQISCWYLLLINPPGNQKAKELQPGGVHSGQLPGTQNRMERRSEGQMGIIQNSCVYGFPLGVITWNVGSATHWKLPWWLSGKEPTCQYWRHEFDLGVGKIPWRRKWQPFPEFLPGKLRDRGAWGATVYGVTRVRHNLETKQHVIWVTLSRLLNFSINQFPFLYFGSNNNICLMY